MKMVAEIQYTIIIIMLLTKSTYPFVLNVLKQEILIWHTPWLNLRNLWQNVENCHVLLIAFQYLLRLRQKYESPLVEVFEILCDVAPDDGEASSGVDRDVLIGHALLRPTDSLEPDEEVSPALPGGAGLGGEDVVPLLILRRFSRWDLVYDTGIRQVKRNL